MGDENAKAFFMGAFIALCAGFMFGMFTAISAMHGRAVDHGCAHYDSQTADFTWNDERPK